MDGIDLEFTDDALKEIVRETMSRKTGARGLRSVMEKTLQQAMFEMPGSDVKNLVITAEMVKNGLKPITVAEKKQGKKRGKNVA
jgi:ATP-dependent Clp protease ATP-binding subunit ClpX